MAAAVKGRPRQAGVLAAYVEPGVPWQKGDLQSFRINFRPELVDRQLFYDLKEVQVQRAQSCTESAELKMFSTLGNIHQPLISMEPSVGFEPTT